MLDIKFFTKCEICRKKRIVIKKRMIELPTGHKATSRKLMCRKCYLPLTNALKTK